MDREIRTILLVDGSASILFYLGMLLRRLEYKVETARNAEDALRMMENAVPSIVVTETSLPNMSGINLLKHIKNTPLFKTVPVVMLTSENDPGLLDTCTRLGCAAYLSKPVEPDVLYRTLQSVSESIPRENIRLNTSLKVIVGDGTAMGGAARIEYATALSEGGLYVRTLYPQPQNALTPIRIFLPQKEITAKAVVLYSFTMAGGPFKEPGMGMKFVEISNADRNEIRSFIKEQLIGDIAPQGS
jgi:CheY-like chemotaxis protein